MILALGLLADAAVLAFGAAVVLGWEISGYLVDAARWVLDLPWVVWFMAPAGVLVAKLVGLADRNPPPDEGYSRNGHPGVVTVPVRHGRHRR